MSDRAPAMICKATIAGAAADKRATLVAFSWSEVFKRLAR